MQQKNQNQPIVKHKFYFQKVDGELQCKIYTITLFRFTTKNISIGEELFFDYGDKFLTKWLTDFNKLCNDYYKK